MLEKNDLAGDSLKIVPRQYLPLISRGSYCVKRLSVLPESVLRYIGARRITCGLCILCGTIEKNFME